MEKTTLNSCPTPIIPPGTDITSTIITTANSIGNVTFEETKSVEILSPYVEAYYSANANALTVNAIVYVDSTAIVNEALVYSVFQNTYLDIDGHAQLQFFIAYDMPEELSGDLSIYEIIFNADSTIFIGGLSKVQTIQTFLWDIDPVTSRGTVTNVQSI
jgi:hypothetical protein